ncbi:hypothetical protein LTR87_017976 [Friedmanniomyces endolithicus]|nr:hypothetical protein LTR87_017976 [Friedmanniomyces endolithicus]
MFSMIFPNCRLQQNLCRLGSKPGDRAHILDAGLKRAAWHRSRSEDHRESPSDTDVTGSVLRDDGQDNRRGDALSAKGFVMNISAASDYLEKWLLERDASVRMYSTRAPTIYQSLKDGMFMV